MNNADEKQKRITILSILMQSTNRKSNALQSIIGTFLQSAHTPQKVIDMLARIGISVSIDTINGAVRSLSFESRNSLRKLSQSLLASYAYDNFDVDLKSQVPTAERSNDSLKHLTSGLLFPLQHGVTVDDLRCSEVLWRMSSINPTIDEKDLPPKRTWMDLLQIHPDVRLVNSLTRRDEFNSWKFLDDLCTHGPQYFQQFRSSIQEPESIEKIPLVKTPIIAARAMDINNSTVSGNIRAVVNLLAQGRVHDPILLSESEPEVTSGSPDISQFVVLVHGDLGTGKRLQAAQLRRSIESTPWNRFQHVIFIPGLFHLKMACANSMWRVFLQSTDAREDETSLMSDVAQLRPKETGIYGSKPGFWRMHQLIGHAGICHQLDCWKVYVKMKNPNFTCLEAFAASEPTLDELKVLADELTQTFVAPLYLGRMRCRPAKERDLQNENALLLNKYFLLYEELSYAMNSGDIGRVETCITSWIPILRATGKHKYASQMTNFLLNIHFVYPSGLR